MSNINPSLNVWPHKSVVYQIYPRSFKDGNNDGIGDLQGIIQQLDYLNDGTENSLGVDAIWLSPIYKSPMADFGYDVADYCDIDPIFGNLKDFELLVKEAHARSIKVIMDYIPNHTSSSHTWFTESRSSLTNKKRDWYIWRDGKNGMPPNNWLSLFGGSAWEYDKTTRQYYLHSFVKEQPDLNWRNPDVKETMLNVLRFWMDLGVDGFRADAMEHIFKDERFLDEPINPEYVTGKNDPYLQLLHPYTRNQPELYSLIKDFAAVLGERQNKFMVNEVNININEILEFYNSNNGTCIPFNFHLMYLPWEVQAYKNFIDELDSSLGSHSPTYVLGNHDCARVATRLNGQKSRIAAMLQLTLRGMPFIYYGDELGMENGHIPPEKIQDPWEKRVPGLGLGRDPARTPMQWSNTMHAGFSSVEPWLPIANNNLHVDSETRNTKSTLNLYRRLIHVRKQSEALLHGNYRSIDIQDKPVLAFTRSYNDENIIVILNFSDTEQAVSFPSSRGRILCNTYLDKDTIQEVRLNEIKLRAYEGYVIRILDK